MANFERLNRVGYNAGPLWALDLGARGTQRGGQLVMSPQTSPNPDRGAEVHFWVEKRQARYHWVSDNPKRPANPTFAVDLVEVPNSQRVVLARHPMEYVVIQALARGEMHGESAASAVHSLFWARFVEDDDGLHYLCKYAEKDFSQFYARERLLRHVRPDYGPRTDRCYEVTSTVEDAMQNHNSTLGERFCRRVLTDATLRAAIEALRLTNESEDVQLANVRRIVELNATRLDYVIAAIVDATRSSQALLGLRACQRVEHDPEFFAAVDAFVLAHPNGRGLISFLKPHCKPPKADKHTSNDAEDDESEFERDH